MPSAPKSAPNTSRCRHSTRESVAPRSFPPTSPRHLDREMTDKPKGWSPLIYCWRGGQRSGALALVLDQIGFPTRVLHGGYRAYRRAVVAALAQMPAAFAFRVVCGPTGSGKSRLLQALVAEGAQVLDLEALANHRGSVLGLVAGQPPAVAEGVRHRGLECAAPTRCGAPGVRREREQEDRRPARPRGADRADACLAMPLARADAGTASPAPAGGLRVLRGRHRSLLRPPRRAARTARTEPSSRPGRPPRARATSPPSCATCCSRTTTRSTCSRCDATSPQVGAQDAERLEWDGSAPALAAAARRSIELAG